MYPVQEQLDRVCSEINLKMAYLSRHPNDALVKEELRRLQEYQRDLEEMAEHLSNEELLHGNHL